MKNTQTCIFFLLLLITPDLVAQKPDCQNVYVWDFKNDKNEKTDITRGITDEVEDIFSQISSCKVLQRRKYATLEKHRQNEIGISNLEGMPSSLKGALKTIEAENVLFGEVKMDFSFNCMVRIRLENLLTKEIKTSTISIDAQNMIDPKKRYYVLEKGIMDFLEIEAVKKFQVNNSFLERMLTDDCANLRSAASKIGLFLSTNCSYRVVNFHETNDYVQIRVHSRGKVWDEYYYAYYKIFDESSYDLLKVTK